MPSEKFRRPIQRYTMAVIAMFLPQPHQVVEANGPGINPPRGDRPICFFSLPTIHFVCQVSRPFECFVPLQRSQLVENG